MMAAPFVAFAASICLALRAPSASLVTLVAALTLSAAMFLLHATDALPISL